jgi:hypothetical protein
MQHRKDRQRKCLSFTFMRKLLAFSLVLAGACASSNSTTTSQDARAVSTKPQVQIMQIGGVPPAARNVRGNISVQYAVEIGNTSAEAITLKAITLKRINVQSVNEGGAYTVRHSQPFDKLITASDRQVVEFFAPAYATGMSVAGANGPVTVRVVAEFEGPRGRFQQVITQVVNTNPVPGQ